MCFRHPLCPVTALTFRTGVDVPYRFDSSRLVAAVFGLMPRVHASGETEQVGRITKCGDAMVRAMLYEAANVMMTRCKADNWLKSWALGVARRRGARKEGRIGPPACRGAASHVERRNQILHGRADCHDRLTGINNHARRENAESVWARMTALGDS